jgi:deoxycytidylate deaminase
VSFDEDENGHEHDHDHRCAYRKIGRFCSNTKEQNTIIDGLISDIPELAGLTPIRKNTLKEELRDGRIGDLLEFSRAVHAEMEAIISAARKGVTTVGAKLFVTTFPCHYCARAIVAAGIDEVQYVEPYPKSQALALHADSITVDAKDRKEVRGRRKVPFGPTVDARTERHLRHLLRVYANYYNRTRTHLSLNKDSPVSRAIEPFGCILPVPILGGLHHQYVRI